MAPALFGRGPYSASQRWWTVQRDFQIRCGEAKHEDREIHVIVGLPLPKPRGEAGEPVFLEVADNLVPRVGSEAIDGGRACGAFFREERAGRITQRLIGRLVVLC